MKGTERQVKWAEEIRQKFADVFDEMEQKIPASHKELFMKCREKLLGVPYAEFWIEKREYATPAGIENLCRKMAQPEGLRLRSEYSESLKLMD